MKRLIGQAQGHTQGKDKRFRKFWHVPSLAVPQCPCEAQVVSLAHGFNFSKRRALVGCYHRSSLDLIHHCGPSLVFTRFASLGHCLFAYFGRQFGFIALGVVDDARAKTKGRASGLFVWLVAVAAASNSASRSIRRPAVCLVVLHRFLFCTSRPCLRLDAWQLAAMDHLVDVVIFARANWCASGDWLGLYIDGRRVGGRCQLAQGL